MMSEHDWIVHAEAAGAAGVVTEDALDVLMDALEERGGAVSMAQDGSRYSATFSLLPNEGDAVEDVTRVGARVIQAAAARAELADLGLVRFEVMTGDEQDAELAEPLIPELVGNSEIADILRVSRQRANQLTKRPNFPAPVARLVAGPIWTRTSIERFLEEWRAGKPDVSDEVAVYDELISKLKNERNALAHNNLGPENTPWLRRLAQAAKVVDIEVGDGDEEWRTSLDKILGRA
jgi:hypothetical protein